MKKKIYIIVSKDINVGAPLVKVFTDELEARKEYYNNIVNWLNFNKDNNSKVIEERMEIESKYIGLASDSEGIEFYFETQEVIF